MSYVVNAFAVVGGIVALLGVFLVLFNLAEFGYERWLSFQGYTEAFRAFLSDRVGKRKRR